MLFKNTKATFKMKNFKFSLPLFSLIMALTLVFITSSFTGKKALPETPRHWYHVEYDPIDYPGGAVLNGTTAYVGFYEKSLVPNSCGGDEIDCMRGFSAQLPEEVFDEPNEGSGAEQILQYD
jgi:hypothetical protein